MYSQTPSQAFASKKASQSSSVTLADMVGVQMLCIWAICSICSLTFRVQAQHRRSLSPQQDGLTTAFRHTVQTDHTDRNARVYGSESCRASQMETAPLLYVSVELTEHC